MLLSRCLVVSCSSYCKYSSLRTSLTTVYAYSQSFGQENLDYLKRYAPLKVAQVWKQCDAGYRQARGFEEILMQYYILPKDSIVRLFGRGPSSNFMTKTIGLGLGTTSFSLDHLVGCLPQLHLLEIKNSTNPGISRARMWD